MNVPHVHRTSAPGHSEPHAAADTVQDGNSEFHSAVHPTWRLVHVTGSTRCVFPRVDASRDLETPSLRMGKQGIPVRQPSLRPLPRSVHFHNGHEAVGNHCPGERSAAEDVSGRLVDIEPERRAMPGGHPQPGGPHATARVQYQSGEIRLHSVNHVQLPRHDVRHDNLHGVSERRPSPVPHGPVGLSETVTDRLVPSTPISPREEGIDGNTLAACKSVQTSPPAGSSARVVVCTDYNQQFVLGAWFFDLLTSGRIGSGWTLPL